MKAQLTERSSNGVVILPIGDVHLGHTRTPTIHILNNLRRYLIYTQIKYNILVINGDLFDKLLHFFNDLVYLICDFIIELLDYCYENDIMIRAVRGTPFHDWDQMRVLVILNKSRKNKVDLKYITTLEYERIEKYQLDVIYLPDEYNVVNSQETLKDVKSLMLSNNLTVVDFLFIHDGFEYQLPMDKHAHDSEEFSKLVKYHVIQSHIHTRSKKHKVYCLGSFDRLKQGEEEPKGITTFSIKNNKCITNFIENKYAKIYKTFNVKGLDFEQVKVILDNNINLPEGSYIRLTVTRTCPFFNQRQSIKPLYPQFEFDYLIESSDGIEDTSESVIDNLNLNNVIGLSKENIRSIILEKISNEHDVSLVNELITKIL